jgi:hypothetical protein
MTSGQGTTSGQDALGRIVLAERRVREAADQWNAVDLSALGHCISVLESSAADLSDATEILKISSTATGSVIRSKVRELKKAVSRLERLVDASSAFLRGAPGPGGDDTRYQAGGSVFEAALSSPSRGTQV